MTIKQILITPEIAKEMLATMENNRTLRPDRVAKLAHDMKNGKFVEGNDSICIDESGHLINGQHRLTAVCASGVSVLMTVRYGVPKDSVIDRPTVRNTADVWKMHGVASPDLCAKECVGIVNAYLRVKLGREALQWSDAQKEDFVIQNADALRDSIKISHKGANKPIMRKAGIQAAVFAAVKAGVSEEKLFRLAECVNTMFYDGESESAAIVLRKYLDSIAGHNSGSMVIESTSIAEQAIRDFVAGKARRLPYKPDKHVYILRDSKEGNDGQIQTF